MTVSRTYLDFNATAPLREEAKVAVIAALEDFGNPSSVHVEGRRARSLVDAARRDVAALVGAVPGEVVFTASGTEGAGAVLAMDWDTIIVSQVEHSAVLAAARRAADRGVQVIEVGVGPDGVIDAEACARVLETAAASGGRTLFALQMANNETGVLQPCRVLFQMARAQGVAVLCDAVQTAGRMPINLAEFGADYLVVSGHKIGAPKGTGALVIRDGARFVPLLTGGGQEQNRRAGTENVAGIAGFGAAARAASEDFAAFEQLSALRDRLEEGVTAQTPNASVIGQNVDRLANTSTVVLPGCRAETLVIGFDLAGIAVSSGAACSSGKVGRSHVLEAMGLEPETAQSAIRISLGWTNTAEDVERFLIAWADVAGRASVARRVA
ncbi:Cysteine desulfurase [Candidatus Filomicrobium marinum]|uniref:Cysteine desulfurase n=2 Tax=Filomicrobium TaxID=119044 RepID=A0A0D6JA42_9HYPH|nr:MULTISPECIES: cysteine desulfurase family protein [Filomicrobium]CFX00808.1 Cysteine desulfurase [Candidatus Filomicrobium marinum]CPR15323.1 Cysteine desulfurase [Candidatus Filomicrobium marinum]SDO67071.1 transcriptional regulator, BadM/Rrf2 family [Filomicrobium insigne]